MPASEPRVFNSAEEAIANIEGYLEGASDTADDMRAEVARLTALLAGRDAAVARAERAESERDVYRDALTLISRGVWTARNSVESIVWGARKALRDGAALATASEGE